MAYRPAPSFCGQCGAPWSLGTTACASCGAPRRAPTLDPPPAMSEGKGLVSALVLYFVLLGTLLAPVAWSGELELETFDTLLLLDAAIVIAWCAAHWRDMLPRLRTVGSARYWLIAIGAIPCTVALAEGNFWVATELFGQVSIPIEDVYIMGGYSLGATLLSIALQPAIVEELAFRGVVFGRLEAILDTRTTIIVTALMFTILHLALLSLVFLVCLGLVLGWLRARSGSLYPGMLLHLGHNAVVLWLAWP